ncbi:MAG: twin-arginine translocation signal domain-containing protein [Peptococcaceae bacterium]|nr:twin-arginine translocation signal domain-containing protein [Peptococcaceae bacterium]
MKNESLSRRDFLKVSSAVGLAVIVGETSLLTGCSSDTGVEGEVYAFTILVGAIFVDKNENTGKYKYKKKCSACGWESSSISVKGVGVSSEYTCPKCGSHQIVRILVSKSGEQGIESDAETLANLMYSINGETQANAKYLAFADVAAEEGYTGVAVIFRAIAGAESQHASDQFAIARGFGSVVRPEPGPVVPGTTMENLQTAFDGETEEYTHMYPEFLEIAKKEALPDAIRIFEYAMQAEEVHAGIFSDLIATLDQIDTVKYAKIYRCPVCGNIELTDRPESCPICSVAGSTFIESRPYPG